jgi:hypothetical protein
MQFEPRTQRKPSWQSPSVTAPKHSSPGPRRPTARARASRAEAALSAFEPFVTHIVCPCPRFVQSARDDAGVFDAIEQPIAGAIHRRCAGVGRHGRCRRRIRSRRRTSLFVADVARGIEGGFQHVLVDLAVPGAEVRRCPPARCRPLQECGLRLVIEGESYRPWLEPKLVCGPSAEHPEPKTRPHPRSRRRRQPTTFRAAGAPARSPSCSTWRENASLVLK